jgi:hypothetical protein
MLRRLKSRTDERRIPMIVLLLYGGSDQLAQTDRAAERPRPLAVSNCAVEAGIETVDLWEPLVALAKTDPKAYYDLYFHVGLRRELWGHMTKRGNAFVARQLAARMQSRGLIPRQ